jgi:hypothetical protein
MHRALRHHTVVLPHHQHPQRAFRGGCRLISLLAPPEGRGIVIGDVHHAWSPVVGTSASVAAAAAAAVSP